MAEYWACPMASLDASFMERAWIAARDPGPRNWISPMWLTSKSPTPVRTAMCSAVMPEYSTGMSQPPKSTILALRCRWMPWRAVLRRTEGETRGADTANSFYEKWLIFHGSTEKGTITRGRSVRLTPRDDNGGGL